MGVIIKERRRYTKPHAFYDGDYKRMEKDKFVAPGWNRYKDSPYAEYKRRVENAKRSEEAENDI